MRLSYLIVGLFICSIQVSSCSVGDEDPRAYRYIEIYKQLAIDEMFRMGVPASVKLAQGMLETEFGTSRLSNEGRNHFGIKCKDYWEGDTILVDDDAPQECFRRYASAKESFIDHSMFLRYHPKQTYIHLFDLNPRDYFSWAYGLKEAGYATNPKYAESLIVLIERYELYNFDDYVLAQLKGQKLSPVKTKSVVATPPPTNPKTPVVPKPLPASATKVFKPAQDSPAATQKKTVSEVQVMKFIAQLPPQSTPNTPKTTDDVLTDTKPLPLDVRELNVNGTHALIANKDLSVFYVAYLYGIPMKKLYQYNELAPGLQFRAGLPIFLAVKQNEPAKGVGDYIAQTGETLYEIAQRFGMKTKKVRRLNPQLAQAWTKGGEIVKLR